MLPPFRADDAPVHSDRAAADVALVDAMMSLLDLPAIRGECAPSNRQSALQRLAVETIDL